MARSTIKGVGKLRRLMKRLPDEMRQEMIVELNLRGREALAAMIARAARRTGGLVSALAFKVFPKTLRLQVGLLTKAVNRKRFYGRILDLGRKAQQVTAKRGASSYAMNVRGIPASHFVTGRRPELRTQLKANLSPVYQRALKKAAAGGGGDD
jgi:hypothetical protein